MLKDTQSSILSNMKLEVVVLGIVFINNMINNYFELGSLDFSVYFTQHTLDSISTFLTIVIGIYITIISILITSTSNIGKVVVINQLDNRFKCLIVTGLISNLILNLYIIFIPNTLISDHYIWLVGFLSVALITFIKFVIVIIQLLGLGLKECVKDIDSKNKLTTDIKYYLELIEKNTRDKQ